MMQPSSRTLELAEKSIAVPLRVKWRDRTQMLGGRLHDYAPHQAIAFTELAGLSPIFTDSSTHKTTRLLCCL